MNSLNMFDGPYLRCPVCNFNHVHVDEVVVVAREDYDGPGGDDPVRVVRVNHYAQVQTGSSQLRWGS